MYEKSYLSIITHGQIYKVGVIQAALLIPKGSLSVMSVP